MKYDVFISYSSKDQKVVEALSHYLESNKIRCFVACRDIPKGVVWAAAITAAIEDSQMMLVVFSDNFNNSDQVDREIEMCSEEKKPILTYRITNVDFKGAKKYYLKNLNWIDAFPNPENEFKQLLDSIVRLIKVRPINNVSDNQGSQNRVYVTPPKTPKQYTINDLTQAQKRKFEAYLPNAKLAAMKVFKDATGVSLADAKAYVDSLANLYRKTKVCEVCLTENRPESKYCELCGIELV